jgi:hypothetical protein
MHFVRAPLGKSQQLPAKFVVLEKWTRYLPADHSSYLSAPELHQNRTENMG